MLFAIHQAFFFIGIVNSLGMLNTAACVKFHTLLGVEVISYPLIWMEASSVFWFSAQNSNSDSVYIYR